MTPESIQDYIQSQEKFAGELEILHKIMVNTGMEGSIKWGRPVYQYQNKNIIGIGAFKNHFGVWFFNGADLSDPQNLLINAQEGKTKAMRQMKFSSSVDMDQKHIKNYVLEALKLAQNRDSKPLRTSKNLPLPEKLSAEFAKDSILKQSFLKLSRGKQNEYKEYILEAKLDSTRERRIHKIIPLILQGKSLYNKYKK